MSLKRILGIALASRMAGRGRRRGALGTAGLLGGLGYRRRSTLGGKAGLAALGYMAYKEYRNYQARNPSQQTGTAGGDTSSASGTSSRSSVGGSPATGSGGIGSMVQDLINKVGAVAGSAASRPGDETGGSRPGDDTAQSGPAQSDGTAPEPTEDELRQDERAAESLSDEKALLLLRAMITAAYADGSLSNEEREGIMSHISEAGGDEEDRRTMEREIADPKSLDELLAGVHDRETAEQVYLASSAAVDGESDANRAYLENLRERLNLTDDEAEEIDALTA